MLHFLYIYNFAQKSAGHKNHCWGSTLSLMFWIASFSFGPVNLDRFSSSNRLILVVMNSQEKNKKISHRPFVFESICKYDQFHNETLQCEQLFSTFSCFIAHNERVKKSTISNNKNNWFKKNAWIKYGIFIYLAGTTNSKVIPIIAKFAILTNFSSAFHSTW